MPNLVSIPLAAAALWSWVAGVWIFLFAGGTQVTETIDASGRSETSIEQISWFQSQGWWGIAILLIFMALYTAPLYFYRRGRTALYFLFTFAAIALSLLAGFSIGPAYLPASAILIVALLLHIVVGNLPRRLRNR
jgi:hypothetical protein